MNGTAVTAMAAVTAAVNRRRPAASWAITAGSAPDGSGPGPTVGDSGDSDSGPWSVATAGEPLDSSPISDECSQLRARFPSHDGSDPPGAIPRLVACQP